MLCRLFAEWSQLRKQPRQAGDQRLLLQVFANGPGGGSPDSRARTDVLMGQDAALPAQDGSLLYPHVVSDAHLPGDDHVVLNDGAS